MYNDERLAKLGGWPDGFGLIPAQYPSIIGYIIGLIMGFVTVNYAFQPFWLRNDGICVAFLFFTVLCFGFAIYNWDKVYKDCMQKGIRIEAEQSRRSEEATQKRNQDYKKSQIDYASQLHHKGGLANLQAACNIYSTYGYSVREISMEIAQEKEKSLDYDGAISGFEELGLYDDAKRVRRKKLDEKRVDQTVVHGDYVDDRDTTYIDDRDTIVKDSVISKSSIGAGGKSKGEQIKVIKDLLDSGAIDDDEFKQMKKEILGK